jgi:Zn-dependent protease with chaperone function
LSPREAALLAAREDWFRKSGASLAIAAVVALWSLSGFLLALAIPSTSGLQAALSGSAVVTVWCFVALFVWPSLNRKMMKQADHSLLSLVSRDELSSLLKKVQTLNRTDVTLPKTKTFVFHPIPPLEDRLQTLS